MNVVSPGEPDREGTVQMMSDRPPAVEVLSAEKVFANGTRGLAPIDLTIAEGEFLTLIGPSGCGKSTLLKLIASLIEPSDGRLLWWRGDFAHVGEAGRRLAFVFQEPTLMPWARVEANVRLPLELANMPKAEAAPIVADAIERVGCTDLVHRSFNTLSGGEKQRVLIARAVAQGADHLILDEPTNHLDIRYQVEILELVKGLGLTVLAALHDLSLASLFCDTVYLLADGRVLAEGSPAEVITADRVHEAYGADVLIVEHPETGTPHLIPRRPTPTP